EPYVTQTATVTSSHGGNDLAATETSTYRGPGGHTLGTFKATAAADNSARGVALRGVGSFLPTGSSTLVSLGLTCNVALEGDDQTSSTWHCAGGVAQKFAKLKRSLGSLTPLTLTVQDADTASGFGRVDFTGSKAALRSSTTKLGVGLDATHALTLTGKSTSAGSDATKGTAAQFALFTPRPTGWSITDPKAHTAFSISVTDKSLRLAGKVVDTRTKAVLATVAVDRSGTGTITYRGAKPVKVVSWLLTG
ncbi:hypothetical protein, partial [Jatrophihabitans endophyticus]|uniref:hypothetical protein n=1 Tax=Jatrophihabitans endophyticus TaxID=1206085 RepID=UPI001A053B2C